MFHSNEEVTLKLFAFESVTVGITNIIDPVDSLSFVNYLVVDVAASLETTCLDFNFPRDSAV